MPVVTGHVFGLDYITGYKQRDYFRTWLFIKIRQNLGQNSQSVFLNFSSGGELNSLGKETAPISRRIFCICWNIHCAWGVWEFQVFWVSQQVELSDN